MELTKVSDLYTETKDGEPILLKRGVKTKLQVHSIHVMAIEEVVSKKGVPLKNKCKVFIRELGPVIVLGSVEKITKEKNKREKLEPIGFLKGFKKKRRR